MSKFKARFLSVVAACVLAALSAATASAQIQVTDQIRRTYTNRPCRDPLLSQVLWDEVARRGINPSTHIPPGGADCDPRNYAHYGRWSSYDQLWSDLMDYRSLLRRQGVTIAPPSLDSNRHVIQTISVNGSPQARIDYGRLISDKGGGLIGNAGGTIINQDNAGLVASGGGNIINQDGASLVAQGGGNFYGVKAAGDVVIQFPGRWVKVSHQASQPPRSTTPPNSDWSPTISDDSILRCLNRPAGIVRYIWAADGGANRFNVTVGARTAYFSGNVLTQDYKNALIQGAKTCGARALNTNNLRVGR
jgi:hypothetical protein